MSHQEGDSISDQIWKGNTGAVERARQLYKHDPKGQLVPFAVALYSFRAHTRCAKELISLYPLLYRAGLEYIDEAKSDMLEAVNSGKKANIGDVLSTHLEWLSRRSELSQVDRTNVAIAAEKVAHAAFPYSEDVHTSEFLRLTLVRLHIAARKYDRAFKILESASGVAGSITDPKQRTRVYAKLGLFYDWCGYPATGFYWAFRALFVSGIPNAVRAKAFAAFLGIDR